VRSQERRTSNRDVKGDSQRPACLAFRGGVPLTRAPTEGALAAPEAVLACSFEERKGVAVVTRLFKPARRGEAGETLEVAPGVSNAQRDARSCRQALPDAPRGRFACPSSHAVSTGCCATVPAIPSSTRHRRTHGRACRAAAPHVKQLVSLALPRNFGQGHPPAGGWRHATWTDPPRGAPEGKTFAPVSLHALEALAASPTPRTQKCGSGRITCSFLRRPADRPLHDDGEPGGDRRDRGARHVAKAGPHRARTSGLARRGERKSPIDEFHGSTGRPTIHRGPRDHEEHDHDTTRGADVPRHATRTRQPVTAARRSSHPCRGSCPASARTRPPLAGARDAAGQLQLAAHRVAEERLAQDAPGAGGFPAPLLPRPAAQGRLHHPP